MICKFEILWSFNPDFKIRVILYSEALDVMDLISDNFFDLLVWISISWTKYFYDVLLLISKMLSSIFSDYQLGLTTVHLSSKHPKFLGGQSWFRQIFWQSNKLKKTNFQQRGGGYINSERCFTIHIWWFGDSLFPRVIRCELVPCVFVSLFIWKPYQKLRIC